MTQIFTENNLKLFAYGGVASILAEFGTFPIDTTKTRLQIQGQKLDQKFMQLRYQGMTDAFIKITKEEGMSALYSGVWPAVLRQAVYGTIKYGTYYTLKTIANDYNILIDVETNKEKIWCNVLCAATAGVISSTIANPTDVLKVRMQVHGKMSVEHENKAMNVWRCFYDIYKYEGMKGLWRGVVPTTQRAIIITSVDLPVYDFCKNHFSTVFGNQPITHFCSSFISSFAAAITSTPMDVIRTRLMNQKNILHKFQNKIPTQKVYRGSIDCAIQTTRYEGVKALYKGFIPAWMRMGPWNAIFFVTYEQLKQL